MTIAIMNYATGEVTLVDYVPDDWEEEQINEYLFSGKGLNLRESDIYYMAASSIAFTHEHYCPKD